MENTKQIWLNYKSGLISEKRAINLLLEILFKNKYEFGLASLDDDEFSDFLVFMNNRFETILKKYDPKISDFSTYIHSVINLTAFWWGKRTQEKTVKNYCCQTMSLEENFSTTDFSPKEEDFYVEEPEIENIIPIPILAKEALRNLTENSQTKIITTKRAKEIVKVLALKSCNNITEHQIKIVSNITGISIEKFHKMLQEAKETLNLKKERIFILQSKRNFAYFQRKKRIVKENTLKEYFAESFSDENNKKDEIRWKKAMHELSIAAPSLVPSNKTVAELLNISARKVKTLLDEAKENFESKSIVHEQTE